MLLISCIIGGILISFTLLGCMAWIIYWLKNAPTCGQDLPPIHIPSTDLQPVHKHIDELPSKILTSIQNSTNTYKGALGELIGYINLRASYDRIIPLHSIVDFLCIKFETKDNPGCIDFVDVKTGHKARLSKDQRALQKLVKEKKINFCQLKVETSDADHSK